MTRLTNEEKMLINSELEKRKQSKLLAYVLLIVFGSLGIHRFFTKKYISGIIQLLLFIFGIWTFFWLVGIVLLFVLYVWLFIDLFLLNGIVDRNNAELEKEIAYEVLASRNY